MSAAILWVVTHRKAIIKTVAALTVAALFCIPLAVLLVIGVSEGDASTQASGLGCIVSADGTLVPSGPSAPYEAIGLSGAEQAQAAANAAVIIAQGQADTVPPRGWTIAIATAIQESKLQNLPGGDRDSVGLFQQRAGWGPFAVRHDPGGSAHMFYTGGLGAGTPGLLDIPGWQSMPLTQAAQAVQRSGFPLAYAQWETTAQQIVAATGINPGLACQIGAAGPWTQPLPAGSYGMSSPFGMRVHPITGILRMHTGQDLSAPCGTPALDASTGTVVRADGRDAGGYGNLVVVQHADGVQTYYAHLSGIGVTVGQQVDEGQQIGSVGQTGAATGCHLHFEVRLNEVPTDPVPWMAAHGAPLGG